MRSSAVLRFPFLVLAIVAQLIAGCMGAISLCIEADGSIQIESASADCCRPPITAHDDSIHPESEDESDCGGSCFDVVLDTGPRCSDNAVKVPPAPHAISLSALSLAALDLAASHDSWSAECHPTDRATTALSARLRC